jgi:hypothetical protein
MYPQLEGSGKGVRHLKLRNNAEVDADFIARVVLAGIDAVEAEASSE